MMENLELEELEKKDREKRMKMMKFKRSQSGGLELYQAMSGHIQNIARSFFGKVGILTDWN